MSEPEVTGQDNTNPETPAAIVTPPVETTAAPEVPLVAVPVEAPAAIVTPPVETTAAPQDFVFPEGVTPDQTVVDSYKAFVAKEGISPEIAQKVIDFQVEVAKTSNASYEATLAANEAALKAHETLGGVNYEKTVALTGRVLKQFGNEELVKTIQTLGLDKDIGFVSLLSNVGNAISEDAVVITSTSTPALDLDNLTPAQEAGLMFGELKGKI